MIFQVILCCFAERGTTIVFWVAVIHFFQIGMRNVGILFFTFVDQRLLCGRIHTKLCFPNLCDQDLVTKDGGIQFIGERQEGPYNQLYHL